ncbi:hypothetical protein LSH36_8g03024 [Paralvinella palmiformis]|uniref:Uncharacterized protein n=1 Tax=Paralvinella palmiformis TaxID=53620 RepID=A0AAD9KEC5_9ANNE|nr:hypothetical protein LSH36_8g03024 [Paralvinella palmiformis]
MITRDVVHEVLHVAQPDVQLAACNAFLQILQEEKVPLQNYTQTFLKSILTSIDNRDPDVANAWLDTLLDVIDLLPKDVIKKDIMSLAVSKGQLSQSVQSRLACCRILGKIATKFDPFIIKKDILPIVQALCQDVDYEVRGCMCRQLDSVARGLGLEQTKSAILPELVELTNDEESYVRLAGLETVVSILSLLDDETCTETIVPLVCKFCQQALSNEDYTLPAVAKQLVNFTEEQKHWFIDYYNKLCKYGAKESAKQKEEDEQSPPKPVIPFCVFPCDMLEEEDKTVETRKNAGYNFPAMVMFAGVRHFKSTLFSSLHSLCSDFHYSVRKTVASGFHEVAKLLTSHASILIPEFITLLQDDSTEVLHGLVEHLPDTLEVLIKSVNQCNSENKAQVHNDLIAAILYTEGVIFASNNWRLQEELMKQLSHITKCFSSEQIFHNFMPLLFRKLLTAKALPVRLATGRTIIILMRKNRKLEQRDEICERLVEGK